MRSIRIKNDLLYFYMNKSVDLIVIESPLEAVALRSVLEWWGVQVNLHLIGKAQDIVDVFQNKTLSPYICIEGHGERDGFLLPELAEAIAKRQLYDRVLTSLNLREFMKFAGQHVLSLACGTGTQEMGKVFLEQGAASYIGPSDYPEGDASLMYALSFYYGHFVSNLSIEKAHKKAKSIDSETGMFELFVDA